MNRYYTLVVMPPRGESRSYAVSSWAWRLLIVAAAMLILALALSVTSTIWLYKQRQTIRTALAELETKHALQSQQLEQAQRYLDKIKELDKDIRDVLFSDEEEAGLGQGGFDEGTPTGAELVPRSSMGLPAVPSDADPEAENIVGYASQVYRQIQELQTNIEKERALYRGFPSILPLQTTPGKKTYWFSSGYGYRIHPLTGARQFHKGVDIATRPGTPIIATADGVVRYVGKDPYLGLVVRIEHRSFQGKHVTTYGHMKAFAEGLKVGDKVTRRQVIGYVGHSGRTTGDHVHYEVSTDGVTQNPMRYITREPQGQIR